MTKNKERDSADREPGAAAWDGDLATVSPAGLQQHDHGLTSYIANLTVLYRGIDTPAWRVRTPEERRAEGFEKWVTRLVEVRNERDRRENQVGVTEYQRMFGTPEWDQPWPNTSTRKP